MNPPRKPLVVAVTGYFASQTQAVTNKRHCIQMADAVDPVLEEIKFVAPVVNPKEKGVILDKFSSGIDIFT